MALSIGNIESLIVYQQELDPATLPVDAEESIESDEFTEVITEKFNESMKELDFALIELTNTTIEYDRSSRLVQTAEGLVRSTDMMVKVVFYVFFERDAPEEDNLKPLTANFTDMDGNTYQLTLNPYLVNNRVLTEQDF